MSCFFFSSRRRHTRCALVTGVQTCALPIYAAGIAGAPVTRWEHYDTHYTERYMGDPRKVPEAYAKSGAIEDAVKIIDPLLVIHGMADDNVVFENSSELIAKLQGGNVPFEMMLYHGFTHRVSGEQV